jgi:hypothetical protein
MFAREQLKRLRTAFKMGAQYMLTERLPAIAKGEIFFKLIDPSTGKVVREWSHENRIVLDSALLIGRLLKDPLEPNHGVNMLSVGTGATCDILNPDIPPNTQRRLVNEIDRKEFSEITFRNPEGVAVAYPTNILDFTCIFSESEAVGPLNEMGLVSTVSDNRLILNLNPNDAGLGGQPYDATIDVTNYDNFINYFTYAVVSKPNNMVLALTWRITV